jgi:hypothetical protein
MKSPPFRYKVISFRTPMGIPGNRMPKEAIVDVDGIPHAGGIDVRFDDVVRTYAWHRIDYADRSLPAEVAP